MRFRQLNSDPNSVMRKKLVKSKKNWIVISSLSLAGGLFLFGAPTYTAQAATTDATATTQTATVNSSTSSSTEKPTTTTAPVATTPVTSTPAATSTESNTDASATKQEPASTTVEKNDTPAPTTTDDPNNVKSVEKDTPVATSTDKDAESTTAIDTDTNTTDTSKNLTGTEDVQNSTKADVSSSDTSDTSDKDTNQTTDTSTDKNNATPVATDVKDTKAVSTEDVKDIIPSDETAKTTEQLDNLTSLDGLTSTDTKVEANLTQSKLALAKLGITPMSMAITPLADALPDGVLAQGTQGTTDWKITSDGILHLGTTGVASTLANNTATTTKHVNTGAPIDTSSTTSTTTTTESPTSPWMDNANDIKTISFDGKVTTASDMSYMFANLTNLTNVVNGQNLILPTVKDSEGFDAPVLTKTAGLFANDVRLVDWSNSSTPNATPKVDLSTWNMSGITDTSNMFLDNSSATQIILPTDTDKAPQSVTNFDYMFKNDAALTSIDFTKWQFNSAKSMLGMFQNDTSLTTLSFVSWSTRFNKPDTGDSEKGEGMFDGTNLTSIILSPSNSFKTYTALPSTTTAGWKNGSKTFGAIPTDTNYQYNLNTITSTLTDYAGTSFSTDGTTAKSYDYTMIIKTNMGDQSVKVSGPLYSIVSASPETKTGFTPDITTVYGNITSTGAINSSYVTYIADKSTMSVPTSTGTNTSVDIPAGAVGTTSDPIDLPKIEGYETSQIKVNYTKDGNVITDINGNPITETNPIKYVGETNTITSDSFNNNPNADKTTGTFYETADTTKTSITSAQVGDKVTVEIPQTDGYTTQDSAGNVITEIKGTIDTTGKFISNDKQTSPENVQYVANTASDWSSNVTIPDDVQKNSGVSSNIVPISGDTSVKTGDPVTIAPVIPGYKVTPGTGVVTVNSDGSTSVKVTTAPKYEANTVTKTVSIPATVGGKDAPQTSVEVTGTTGSIVTVKVPVVDGYTADKSTVTATVDPQGNITTTDKVTYTPVKSKDGQTTTFTAPDGTSKTVSIPAGEYGDTSKTVTVPEIPGYTRNTDTVPVTYDKEGNAVVDTTGVYTPVQSKGGTQTFTTDDGITKNAVIPTGEYGDTSKTVTVPEIPGYTLDPSSPTTLPVKYDTEGKATVDTSKVKYIPNKVPEWSTSVTGPNNSTVESKGSTNSDGTEAKIGDTVSINPDVPGYTTVKTGQGKIVADENGNPIVKIISQPEYAPKQVTKDVTIPTNKGNQVVKNVTGKTGDTVKVTVPSMPGYTVNPTTIDAIVNPDGSITPADPNVTITYTKIPSSNSNVVTQPVVTPPTTDQNVAPETKHQNIATYGDQPDVQVYSLDGDNTMQDAGLRNLAHGTGWFSDQIVTVAGVKYYRVATNEYVKATQVYPYQDVKLTIETHDVTDKPLYDAAGTLIKNENLGAYTDWKSDRLVTIDGTDYYRVSIGSFVKASDVNPYQTIKSYVRVDSNVGTVGIQVYDSQGKAINRTVSANSAWFTDRITYIHGVKYYRIATDEYVKFDDVAEY